MFSKSRRRLIVYTLLALLIGCARENIADKTAIEVDLKGSNSCVTNIGGQLSKYVDGKMNREEVENFWNCINSAVTQFQSISSGDMGIDRYSPDAFRRFFKKFFIQEKPISDELLDAFMDLKQVILSGSNKVVTRGELDHLREIIMELKGVSLMLNSHMPVLLGRKKQATDAEVRAATAAARGGLGIIGAQLFQQGHKYSFVQFKNLLLALNICLNDGGNPSETFQSLLKKFKVLPAAKQLLMAGDPEFIEGKEWIHFSEVLGRIISFYVESNYSFEKNMNAGLNSSLFLDAMEVLSEQLNNSILLHQDFQIPLDEFQRLFAVMHETGVVSENFTPEALQGALNWFLRRMLGDGVHEPSAISLVHVSKLRLRLADWAMIRKPSTSILRENVTVDKFERLLADSPAMEWDELSRLVFRSVPQKEWSLESRRQIAFPFTVLNWIKDSYVGTDVDRLTLDQMNEAVAEVLPIIHSFGWLADVDNSVGGRRYYEANLFTSASNGDDYLDLTEAVRYLAFITSAYVSADHWLKTADQVCPEGRPPECVRAVGFDTSNDILSSMPVVQKLVKKWGRVRFNKYLMAAETAILGAPASDTYGVGTLLQVWQLMEYDETFMQRFDRNRNQSIDLAEATRSYSVYGTQLGARLRSKFPDLTDDDVWVFFTFLMRFGEDPFNMWGGQEAMLNWKSRRKSWVLNAQRDTLMGILAGLSKK
jgi:hypothetical protein